MRRFRTFPLSPWNREVRLKPDLRHGEPPSTVVPPRPWPAANPRWILRVTAKTAIRITFPTIQADTLFLLS